MSSFLLDKEGDLEIIDNKLSLTEGIEAIRQHLKVKFQLFQGEWFLDTGVGVPYYEKILVKGASIGGVSEILKLQILETPGVKELLEFDFGFDEIERKFSVSFKALTTEGILDFTQFIGA